MNKYVLVLFLLSLGLDAEAQNSLWSVDEVFSESKRTYQVRQYDAANGFRMTWTSPYAEWRDMAIGDSDNDGQNEMILATDYQLFIYEKNNPLPTIVEIGYGIDSIRRVGNIMVKDVDNDSKNEVIVQYRFKLSRTYVFKYRQGVYELQISFANPAHSWHMDIGDVDNDGKNELIYGDTNKVAILSCSQATNPITTKYIIPSKGWNNMAIVADVDNDGLNELLAGGNFSSVRIWKFRDGAFTQVGEKGFSGYTPSLKVADVNSDSKNELIAGTASFFFGTISVLSFSSGAFSTQWSESLDFNVRISAIEIGDADNDGKQELAVWGEGGVTLSDHQICGKQLCYYP